MKQKAMESAKMVARKRYFLKTPDKKAEIASSPAEVIKEDVVPNGQSATVDGGTIPIGEEAHHLVCKSTREIVK